MIYNLVGNPTFSLELKRHRKLLDQWLVVGDMGSEAEPIANLKANGDGKKWGEGVNPEYEKYRVDSDGDGLSDSWEIANKRDPVMGCFILILTVGVGKQKVGNRQTFLPIWREAWAIWILNLIAKKERYIKQDYKLEKPIIKKALPLK